MKRIFRFIKALGKYILFGHRIESSFIKYNLINKYLLMTIKCFFSIMFALMMVHVVNVGVILPRRPGCQLKDVLKTNGKKKVFRWW